MPDRRIRRGAPIPLVNVPSASVPLIPNRHAGVLGRDMAGTGNGQQTPDPYAPCRRRLIAIGAIAGAIVGLYTGQPSSGFLIGTGGGVVIAVAMWLLNVRR